jgi:hypothetical protein
MSYVIFDCKVQVRNGVTFVWSVRNAQSGVRIGLVKWWPAWRKYVYQADDDTIYDPACLREIADWVEARTKEHRDDLARIKTME